MPAKELNEVRMIGVLPSQGASPIPVGKIPDGAIQVIESGAVNNSTAELHEVSAGTTFYLTTVTLGIRNNNAAAQFIYLEVRNVGDVAQYSLFTNGMGAGQGGSCSATFNPPLEIPAGWDIFLTSLVANMAGYATIHGYEL